VLLLHDRLLANIERGQQQANRLGISFRPQRENPQSCAIARLQNRSRGKRTCLAKADEAGVFLRAGIKSITVAHPLFVASKFRRLVRLANELRSEISFIADSLEGVDLLEKAIEDLPGGRTGVFVKVDVGLHRCGVDPASASAIEVVRPR